MWEKVIKDNIKTFIPFKEQLRRAIRKISPYQSNPANDELAFNDGLYIVEALRRKKIKEPHVLEIGTGWIPIIPKILKAYGARKIVMTDIEKLCDENTLRSSGEIVDARLHRLADKSQISVNFARKNLSSVIDEEYRCPPRLSEIAGEHFDLIYSRAVLEHMNESSIQNSINHWKRILKPGGHMIHIIDNSDHFEHGDKSISKINFLKYSNSLWRLACLNPQNFQNRLRHSDYRRIFAESGFEIVEEHGEPDAQCVEDVKRIQLSHEFQNYDVNDLAIITSTFICKKPAD